MISNTLRQLRKKAGMTQFSLGNALGVSQQTIAQWEKGTRKPDGEAIKKIALYFDVSVDYLMGLKDESLQNQISNNIKKIREKMGISSKELASCLCVDVQYIEEIENGTITPTTSEIKKIASGLWTTPEELLSMTDVFDVASEKWKFLEDILGASNIFLWHMSTEEKTSIIITCEGNVYETTPEQLKQFEEGINDFIVFSAKQMIKKSKHIHSGKQKAEQ